MNKNYLIINSDNKIVQIVNCSEEEKVLNPVSDDLKYVEYSKNLPTLNPGMTYAYKNDTIVETAFTDSIGRNYEWNGTRWILTLEEAKKSKYEEIKLAQTKALNSVMGEVASFESASYTKQEIEARAWNSDNNTSTPFIDNLLISRNLGETKQELVDKIIAKADAYQVFYASMLGKFQALVKQIDAATTADEVNTITWN